MNKKLIGGIVVIGGVSVIAYYFLFSKKSEKKLIEKFEENKKIQDELTKIETDLKVEENPFSGKTIPSPYSTLSAKEMSEIDELVKNIGVPKIDIVPMDYSGLQQLFKGFDISSVNLDKIK